MKRAAPRFIDAARAAIRQALEEPAPPVQVSDPDALSFVAFAEMMRAKVTTPAPPPKQTYRRGHQGIELAGTRFGDRKPSTAKKPAAGGCAHHWVIEEPNGEPRHHGQCKRCGLEKDFRASLPDDIAEWRDDQGNGRKVVGW